MRRSTLENTLTVQYAALVSQFTIKARAAIRKLSSGDDEDDLRLIRVRSSFHEIIVAPDFDKVHDYQLIVIQDPSTM
jgi:dynein light chain roadblock-type